MLIPHNPRGGGIIKIPPTRKITNSHFALNPLYNKTRSAPPDIIFTIHKYRSTERGRWGRSGRGERRWDGWADRHPLGASPMGWWGGSLVRNDPGSRSLLQMGFHFGAVRKSLFHEGKSYNYIARAYPRGRPNPQPPLIPL